MAIEEIGRPPLERLLDGLSRASDGHGPLLQRDYWAVIAECTAAPAEIAEAIATDFPIFSPEELVRFERLDGGRGPLPVGAELQVTIRMAGGCRVRVLHRDRNSITLGTMHGHPEAGRITFGAYPNEEGDTIFHIRSRARQSSVTGYAGWVAIGEPMQTNTWTDFIDRVAHTFGTGVVGAIHAETREIEDDLEESPEELCSPTFLARGG